MSSSEKNLGNFASPDNNPNFSSRPDQQSENAESSNQNLSIYYGPN